MIYLFVIFLDRCLLVPFYNYFHDFPYCLLILVMLYDFTLPHLIPANIVE